MKEETTSKYTVTVREILEGLGISGECVSCGFNMQKKVDSPLDRELSIVVARKGKVTVRREMTIQMKKKKEAKKTK